MSREMELFKEKCNEVGIDFNTVFCCGTGRTYYSKGNNQRYEFKTSNLEPFHQYALKYFAQERIFLCWRIIDTPKRTVFSAGVEAVQKALEREQSVFQKGIEFRFLEQENVYLIKEEEVESFIRSIQNQT